MTGSLRLRASGTWELRVYLGVDRVTRKERWATKAVHGTRRYATSVLEQFVEEAGYSRLRSGDLADLLDRWIEQASPAWSPTTVTQTRSIVEHHLKPSLGAIAVAKLSTIDIDGMYRNLLRCGGPGGRALAPGTVRRVHVVLHRALAQAVRWEWIWLNPVSNASPPKVAPAACQPPSPQDVQRLLAAVESADVDFATYLWLAAATGARRSQMLGLRWADIDIAHSAIGFSRAYVDGPTGPVLRATKTHRTYRASIDDAACRRLVDHHRRANQRAVAARTGVDT